jgi:hypothetical protein
MLSKLRGNENFGRTEGKGRERMTSMMIIGMMLTTMWEYRGKKRNKSGFFDRGWNLALRLSVPLKFQISQLVMPIEGSEVWPTMRETVDVTKPKDFWNVTQTIDALTSLNSLIHLPI